MDVILPLTNAIKVSSTKPGILYEIKDVRNGNDYVSRDIGTWLSRTRVKLAGSVSTIVHWTLINESCRSQAVNFLKKCSYSWGPVSVHPLCSLGNVILYAKVEATRESTKAKMVSIAGGGNRGNGGIVEGRKKRISFTQMGSICSP